MRFLRYNIQINYSDILYVVYNFNKIMKDIRLTYKNRYLNWFLIKLLHLQPLMEDFGHF